MPRALLKLIVLSFLLIGIPGNLSSQTYWPGSHPNWDRRDPAELGLNPAKMIAEIKKLLVQQIEKPVRWRESVINLINSGVQKFIEIGPGKVLSGLVKRIDRNVK